MGPKINRDRVLNNFLGLTIITKTFAYEIKVALGLETIFLVCWVVGWICGWVGGWLNYLEI